jgi:hypothetical protein
VREAGDRLGPGRDEHVPLTGPDGVQRHPGGLQARGAVALHRRPRDVVEAEGDGDHARQAVALLAGGLGAAHHQVVHGVRVERGHLVQGRADHGGGEVVGAHPGEGALEGPADRGTGRGDDHGFGHGNS